MTVAEVIKKVDALRRNNSFTVDEKMLWLNQCEAKVQLDCLLMPKVEVQYKYGADNEEELIAPTPYDDLYVYYICARIDEALGEMAMYNDSVTAFNDVHGNFQKWLIKTYNPARNKISLKRNVPEIYRGDKAYITLYGLPVKAENISSAKALITQGETQAEITEVETDGDTLKFTLSEAQTYGLTEGSMYAGFDIEDNDGYRYKDEKAQRFYMRLSPELSGAGDTEGGSAVDASLTIDGRAADAGATGARIGAAETRLTSAENRLTAAETSLTGKETKGLVSAEYEFSSIAAVEAKIIELTQAMDAKAIKYFTWYGTGEEELSSGVPYAPTYWLVKIDKIHASNYAIVEMETYVQGGMKVRNIMSAGALNGWEWIDCPNTYGVEYRTTEKYNGSTVYVKTVNAGAAEDGKAVEVGNITAVRAAGRISKVVLPHGLADGSTTYYAYQQRQATQMKLYCGTGFSEDSSMVWYFTIWYTKD